MAKRISATPQARQTSAEHKHEEREVHFGLLIFVLIFVFLSAFLIHGVVWGWIRGLPRGWHQRYGATWQVISSLVPEPNGPALQVQPHEDLGEVEKAQQQRLHSYGWINPQAGIIHIPIERAAQIIAEKGLPQWAPDGRATFVPSGKGAGPKLSPLELQQQRTHSGGEINKEEDR